VLPWVLAMPEFTALAESRESQSDHGRPERQAGFLAGVHRIHECRAEPYALPPVAAHSGKRISDFCRRVSSLLTLFLSHSRLVVLPKPERQLGCSFLTAAGTSAKPVVSWSGLVIENFFPRFVDSL